MFQEISFLVSPELQHKLLGVRIFSWLISLFFLVTIIYFLTKTHYLKYRWRKTLWAKDYRHFKSVHLLKKPKEWIKVERLIKSDLLSENKLAVVKAGALLDRAFKAMGYPKGDWSERLSQAITDSSFDFALVLKAFKLRENILQDPDQVIKKQEAQEAVKAFRQALVQLNYF